MPFFEQIWLPVLELLKGVIGKESFISYILIGQEVSGKIDIEASFGLLTTGLYVPIGAVLPYIISFYFVLGFLEDTGYLPRLATQVDNVLHKIGLHGYAVVPMVLAMGCNVPGALATRLLETRREKFIAMTLMAVAVPCMAQIAMIVGLVGERGGRYVALIFGVLFSILIVKGLILNRFIKGASPEVLWEIPPYRMPQLNMVIKKLSMRISGFIAEALPIVLAGVFVINILNAFKVFDFLSSLAAPLLTGLWGLPRETISALVIGFFRKDVAVGMLAPLDLTTKQLVIACTVLSIYFPCIATFLIMIKELGIRDMARSAILMVLTSIIVGTFLNLIL
jgi:ferrous iron transport protein B